MTLPRSEPRTLAVIRRLAPFAIGIVGTTVLAGLTSQGYLHATVVTGAGYAGPTEQAGPLEQLLAAVAWIAVGGVAGFAARAWSGLLLLWAGGLLGSLVGIAGDPQGNIL